MHRCVETSHHVFECNESSTKNVCVFITSHHISRHETRFPHETWGNLTAAALRSSSRPFTAIYNAHRLMQQTNFCMTGQLRVSVLPWHENHVTHMCYIPLYTVCAVMQCWHSVQTTLFNSRNVHSCVCVCVYNRGFRVISSCLHASLHCSLLHSLSFHIKMLALFSQEAQ